MAEKRKWIKAATANAHGQFAAKAKAAGKTTAQYAAEKADAPGRLGKQARLAKTLMAMHHNEGGMVGSTGLMTDQRARAERMYKPKGVSRHG